MNDQFKIDLAKKRGLDLGKKFANQVVELMKDDMNNGITAAMIAFPTAIDLLANHFNKVAPKGVDSFLGNIATAVEGIRKNG